MSTISSAFKRALLRPLSVAALLSASAGALLPSTAQACGGLFCNPATPVNQQAERILFAQDPTDSGKLQMHVRLVYQGEAEDFSWLLPVPPGTQFELSRESMFDVFDANFAPLFTFNTVIEGECDFDFAVNEAGGLEAGTSAGAPGIDNERTVTVTSREEVGPYDKVTLRATDVSDLIDWLDRNGFDQPEGTEDVLRPYLNDYEFLAIKLRTNDSSSVTPVMLTFSGDTPAVPMRPTSVAATPDMGVIVHIMGSERAIPTNFAHAQVNEAAIDWVGRGSNYSDVVSQAIDEAPNGHAFVTDFAGEHGLENILTESAAQGWMSELEMVSTLSHLAEFVQNLAIDGVLNDRDFSVTFRQALITLGLEEALVSQLLEVNVTCDFDECLPGPEVPQDATWAETPFDPQPLISELNAFYEHNAKLNQLFSAHPYLSRLYTTLSPNEMTLDPVFAFNPDLEPVARRRTATLYQTCEGQNLRLVTPGNVEIDLTDEERPELITRQDGQTIRGQEQAGAALIERTMSAGQSEVIIDNRASIDQLYRPETSTEDLFTTSSESVVGCEQGGGVGSLLALLLSVFALIGLRRREA